MVVYRDRTLETITSGGHQRTNSNDMNSAYGKAVVDRMDRLDHINHVQADADVS